MCSCLLSLINVPTSVLSSLPTHENWALGQERERATHKAQVGELETEKEKRGFRGGEDGGGAQVSRLLESQKLTWRFCIPPAVGAACKNIDSVVPRLGPWASLKTGKGLLQRFVLFSKKEQMGSRRFPEERQIGWLKMSVSLLWARISPAQCGRAGSPQLIQSLSGQSHPSLWLMNVGEIS